MSVETWGQLDKSQSDSEKVEGAIARLIAEHEADPDSHLGSGESLEAHRASEIIDHTAGSVVADKKTSKQWWFETSFDSFDSWNVVSGTPILTWPGVEMITSAVLNNEVEMITEPADSLNFFDWSKNQMFQATVYLGNLSNTEKDFFWGVPGVLGDSQAFGFRVRSGVLQAYCTIDGVESVVDLSTVSTSGARVYRAIIDTSAGKIDYYVNSVLVATIDGLTLTSSDTWGLFLRVKTLTAGVRNIIFYHILVARDF